jgi:predicted sugar kinase
MTDAKEPESVRALRRIRELYADVDAWVTWADDGQPLEAYAGELLDHIDTLTRERDETRRDAARLDWLDTQMDGVHVEAGVAGGEYQMSWFATVYTFCDEFRAGTVREAIDKAMNHARTAALTQGDA